MSDTCFRHNVEYPSHGRCRLCRLADLAKTLDEVALLDETISLDYADRTSLRAAAEALRAHAEGHR